MWFPFLHFIWVNCRPCKPILKRNVLAVEPRKELTSRQIRKRKKIKEQQKEERIEKIIERLYILKEKDKIEQEKLRI